MLSGPSQNTKINSWSDQYKDQPNWWAEIYTIFHIFKSTKGRAPEYALEPNPPTTHQPQWSYRYI